MTLEVIDVVSGTVAVVAFILTLRQSRKVKKHVQDLEAKWKGQDAERQAATQEKFDDRFGPEDKS